MGEHKIARKFKELQNDPKKTHPSFKIFKISHKKSFSWIFMYDKLVLELLEHAKGAFKIYFGGHLLGFLK